jgi:hypothetical protein
MSHKANSRFEQRRSVAKLTREERFFDARGTTLRVPYKEMLEASDRRFARGDSVARLLSIMRLTNVGVS